MLNFNNLEEMFSVIRTINEKYYKQAVDNIIFLEEYENKSRVVYITQIRDAYSHLVEILKESDVIKQKEKILSQITRYSTHLERIVVDTFQRIIGIKKDFALNIIPETERDIIKTQIALKVKELRFTDDTRTTDIKIDGYIKLEKLLDSLLARYHAPVSISGK